MNTPCKDCEKRTNDCHISCKDYKLYKAKMRIARANRAEFFRQYSIMRKTFQDFDTSYFRRKR
jgi:hypothetical protein